MEGGRGAEDGSGERDESRLSPQHEAPPAGGQGSGQARKKKRAPSGTSAKAQHVQKRVYTAVRKAIKLLQQQPLNSFIVAGVTAGGDLVGSASGDLLPYLKSRDGLMKEVNKRQDVASEADWHIIQTIQHLGDGLGRLNAKTCKQVLRSFQFAQTFQRKYKWHQGGEEEERERRRRVLMITLWP